MQHDTTIRDYPGSLPQLAEALGDLRYDALAELLHALSDKLRADAQADSDRGRPRLARRLRRGAEAAEQAAREIDAAWAICEPRMRD